MLRRVALPIKKLKNSNVLRRELSFNILLRGGASVSFSTIGSEGLL